MAEQEKAIMEQGQQAMQVITPEMVEIVRKVVAPDLNDLELKLFLHRCQAMGADPLSKLIHPIKRQGRLTFQSSIDYFRARAESTGLYDGQDPIRYDYDDAGKLESATCTVHKKGSERGTTVTAYWDEFLPAPPNDFMWRKMPRVMLGKVAEAQALRKAFPEKLHGLYEAAEMEQAGGQAKPEPYRSPVEDMRKDVPALESASLDAGPYPDMVNEDKPVETPPVQAVEPKSGGLITASQVTRLYTVAGNNALSNDEAKEVLKKYGFMSSKQVTSAKYDTILEQFNKVGMDRKLASIREINAICAERNLKPENAADMFTDAGRVQLADLSPKQCALLLKKLSIKEE